VKIMEDNEQETEDIFCYESLEIPAQRFDICDVEAEESLSTAV
jgi:hypothetical protein